MFVEGRDEGTHVDPVAADVRALLTSLGEDVERLGLERTPERVARMYRELLSGYHMDARAVINGALFPSEYEGIVVVRDIEFHSLCEHHLLPFFGRVHVAYLPDKQVVGLSKIPRIVDMFAHRLQLAGADDAADRRVSSGRAAAERCGSYGRRRAYVYAHSRGGEDGRAAWSRGPCLGAFKDDPELEARPRGADGTAWVRQR